MSISEIMAILNQWSTKRIIFTGGEPALQDLRPLSDELHSNGYNIAIETNGTVELEEGLVDWICVSPKDMLYPEFSIKPYSSKTGSNFLIIRSKRSTDRVLRSDSTLSLETRNLVRAALSVIRFSTTST